MLGDLRLKLQRKDSILYSDQKPLTEQRFDPLEIGYIHTQLKYQLYLPISEEPFLKTKLLSTASLRHLMLILPIISK